MRRHPLPDNDIPEQDSAAGLQQAFALLLPIRRQRLRRSERLQREAERALRDAERQADLTGEQLARARLAYQQLRDSFAERHQTGVQKQERLQQGLGEERQASETVVDEQNQLAQWQHQQVVRQQSLQEAQQETQRCQRDVEKLEYLMQHSEALR